MALKYTLSPNGKTARDETVGDIDKAIEEMKNAIAELQKTKGLGAELFIARIEELIDRFTKIKTMIQTLVK